MFMAFWRPAVMARLQNVNGYDRRKGLQYSERQDLTMGLSRSNWHNIHSGQTQYLGINGRGRADVAAFDTSCFNKADAPRDRLRCHGSAVADVGLGLGGFGLSICLPRV